VLALPPAALSNIDATDRVCSSLGRRRLDSPQRNVDWS
jgi:hypothetical protein